VDQVNDITEAEETEEQATIALIALDELTLAGCKPYTMAGGF
jgi:hypothetical protein